MLRDYLRRAYRTIVPFIYSKRNYKLFMQKSFIDLDDRIRSLICATDTLNGIVKPVEIMAPFGRSMLVVAPHQDDEIIGCGGAMALQAAAGGRLSAVFIQDGGGEHGEKGVAREELVRIREGEARGVAARLGMSEPVFLRHERIDSDHVAAIASELREEIERTECDVIFVPFFLDTNKEHRMTNRALAGALKNLKGEPRILCYEVWGLCVPNVIVNIDSVIEMKKNLLFLYASQLESTDYLNSTIGLNMYHSREFGAGVCRYAERFFEIPSVEYVGVVNKVCSEKQYNTDLQA